ncbi:hypothetical protein [uncultured Salipiger sp.]|uniref:hypothetical protein n=1 Tax=uncultured Salipiger sp. TaxID=499810 RepID=UPI002591F6FC|nr:hypothetical protein [uncultured Salipiger sp.]
MADNGVRSIDNPEVALFDDLFGHMDGTLGRVPRSVLKTPGIIVDQIYSTVASLMAATETSRGEGAVWATRDGGRFIETAADADPYDRDSNPGGYHFETSAGVKLRLPYVRVIDVREFNPPTDGVTDASAALQAALDLFRELVTGDAPDADLVMLRVVGRYTTNTGLLLQFDAVQTGKGVIDMSGGQITAGAGLLFGTLFRVRTNAITRNLCLQNVYLRRGTSFCDVLLELDGGHQNNGSLARWMLLNPTLLGSKVPLWIRNNAFEGVIVNPNFEATQKQQGYYGILVQNSFDGATPGSANGNTVTGVVSSVSVYGGTVKNGLNNIRLLNSIDLRVFGTTFLNSGGEMFRNTSNISGMVHACHFENAWDTPAWAPGDYAAGDFVQNDGGKVYMAATGGTSAASGGPTGTGEGISDGSVVWDYVPYRGVVRMDSDITIDGCDYRQNVGLATHFIRSYLSDNRRATLGDHRILSGVGYLYLSNNEDNGARLWAPAAARGKIAYHPEYPNGNRMVSFPRPGFWNSPGSVTGNVDIDYSLGDTWFYTANGNVTFNLPTNAAPGDRLTIMVRQDETGGRTVSFASGFRTAGTVVTTANTITSWTFVYSGTAWTQIGNPATGMAP